MNINIILFLFLSVVSLLGTLIGSALGLLIKNPSKRLLGAMIGFAAGLMLSVVVFDLIPECLKKWSFNNTIMSIIAGIIIIYFGDNLLNKKNICANKHLQVAILTAVGLMLHNFPEGIIMGCSFLVGGSLGVKMCILIAIHDVPEGLAVTAPMVASKINPVKIFIYTAITALPTAFGAAIGLFIGGISKAILGSSLGLASGIMIYVVFFGMIPEAMKLWGGRMSKMGILLGVLLGFTMCTNL
ncbi:ZIP family metal transporter [Clostridium akagii]|uniref:ZIP family metal transporter n=1 Tax=Clostridium akagii TaxID=91623 RepID=UPI00047A602A|nr:ZIP family metal transporter [Clostridium akagii]